MRAQSESWLRGPIAGVHPMLMPAAHALLQTMADAEAATAGLSVEELWKLPGTAAPIGFHLKHLAASTEALRKKNEDLESRLKKLEGKGKE